MKIDDNLIYIYNSIIVFYSQKGDYENVLVYAKNGYDKFKDEQFLLNIGKSYARLFQFDNAEKYLLEIEKSDDIKVNVYKELFLLYKNLRQFDKCEYYIDQIFNNVNHIDPMYIRELPDIKNIYGQYLLLKKDYINGFTYYKYYKYYHGFRNLLSENCSFFNGNDTGKTLLIYNCGGFGDILMYARFIDKVSKKYSKNNIIFAVDDKLLWLYNLTKYCNNENVKIISEKDLDVNNLHYDYYTDVLMLSYFLNLEYNDIYFDKYFVDVPDNLFYNMTQGFYKHKKKIVINWHGNRSNSMDKFKRTVSLELLKPLFSIPNITWISVQKEVEPDEKEFLKDNNIVDLSEYIDNGNKAFNDTISIFKNVDLVISTDTSLAHLAATLGINTWILLTYTPEWRWGLEGDSVWYPDAKIFRQNRLLDWTNVIQELLSELIND